MENAAYVGLSRQMTLRRELDIVANNIANADTTGFKVEQLLVGTEVGERARNAFIRPSASFVLDKGVGRDFGQGSMQQTGRSLDFAISGEGAFFTVRDGANGEAQDAAVHNLLGHRDLGGLPRLGEHLRGPDDLAPGRHLA